MAVQDAFLTGGSTGRCERRPAGRRGTCRGREGGPDLKRRLAEVRDIVSDVIGRVAVALHEATGVAHAADVLAQWEGFGGFCRDVLGVEPLMLTAAFGLGRDPAAAVLEAYPQIAVDEAEIARWTGEWARTWARRFGA